ncbi:hypothetical protein QFC22_006479 [Naganishia vaughanmartiniae]|uniref:Uncharacterized protein n=1 Tax=Naganishia vaughanmartiniae TaxID=1424756 RepID=A0ACC2WIN7_9TREE|nr:hypothetical protein QFC22_006479 [Naganishia vaughanmartiniae]
MSQGQTDPAPEPLDRVLLLERKVNGGTGLESTGSNMHEIHVGCQGHRELFNLTMIIPTEDQKNATVTVQADADCFEPSKLKRAVRTVMMRKKDKSKGTQVRLTWECIAQEKRKIDPSLIVQDLVRLVLDRVRKEASDRLSRHPWLRSDDFAASYDLHTKIIKHVNEALSTSPAFWWRIRECREDDDSD